MTTSIPAYPVDYTGVASTNLITNETQVLTGGVGDNFYFIVPEFAPYFADSLTIIYTTLLGASRYLVAGIDYYPTNEFIGATRACAKAIYGSISFLNMSLIGSLTLQYQTLGGTWLQNPIAITNILANQVRNPFVTSWEQVTDTPGLFPVVNHAWNLTDMVGMSDILTALNAMTDAIIAAGYDITTSHISDISNPHQVTAAQIGAVTQAQLQAAVSTAITNSSEVQTYVTEAVVGVVSYNTSSLTLTGLEVGSITPITSTNTILQALANLQAQITAGSGGGGLGIATPLTGFVSGAGTVSATDTILSAIEKINGNIAGINVLGIATPLTGLSSGSDVSIISSNTILQALANLQAQINAGSNLGLASVLTGYSVGTNTPLASTNTILQGFQNLQAQINAAGSLGINSPITGYVSGAGTVSATDTLLIAIQKLNGNTSVLNTTVNGAVTGLAAETNRAEIAEALLVPKTTTINSYPLSSNVTLAASDVGLGNVNNTSDVNKPVSTAQAAADAAVLSAAEAYAGSLVTSLWEDCGSYNASANNFPITGGTGTSGAINKGDIWTISVVATTGPLLGYAIGCTIRALINNPGQTVTNWAIAEVGLGYVPYNATNPAGYITTNQPITFSGDAFGTGSTSVTLTVTKLNGTSLAGLATGLLKVTTGTGNVTIAAQSDITSLLGSGSITNTMLANTAVANLSGTNTGDQTITVTGDMNGSGTGSFAVTLPVVNVNVGSFGGNNSIPTLNINAKGQVTGASVTTPSGTWAISISGNAATASAGPSGAFGTGAYTATYSLPTATTTTLGGVKVDGSSIVITNGVISATSSGSAAANALIGTTLATNVTASSLTSAAGGTFASGAYAIAYSLPVATNTVLGGVKPDNSTIINSVGNISVNYGATSNTACVGNDSRLPNAISANVITISSVSYTLPTTPATIARTDAAQTFTGVQTFAGNVTHQAAAIFSTTTAITAAGTALNTGTQLTTDINFVTTVPSGTGVVLPSPTLGREVTVVNRGANALLVYPASSNQIDGGGTSQPTSLPPNSILVVVGQGGSQWYAVTPVYVAGSGMTVTQSNNGTVTFTANPQGLIENAQSANYTCVLSDANGLILHPSADTVARTFTIPANASVAYPVGTCLTFANSFSSGVNVTIAITTDTMRLVPAGTTGSRTLAAGGNCTALKITATEWQISGNGLT